MSATPSLAQIINDAIEARLGRMNTCLPARVVRVDVTKAQCDVEPVLRSIDASGNPVTLPVISNVPIAVYRAGNAFISLPVKVGHFVELRFSQRSLDTWLTKGGIVDPNDRRKFNLSDAIAYPGVYPFSNPPTGATADDVVIKNEGSKITIKPDGEIAIEGSAIRALAESIVLSGEGDAVALASKVLEELEAIKSWADAHTHDYIDSVGSAATPTPKVTGAPTGAMPAPESVASEKVLAE